MSTGSENNVVNPDDQVITPGSPEYDKAMADKVDENAQKAANDAVNDGIQKAEKPEWLPEKFWNAETGEADYEAMSRSYGELETKLSKPADQENTEDNQGDTEGDQTDDDDKVEDKNGELPPMSMSNLQEEYLENGELSPESYAALEARGFTAEDVDQYIAGQQALADQYRAEMISGIGGEEAFEAMSAWAAENLSEAEIDAFNKATESGMDEGKMAIEGVFAKFQAAGGGIEPSLVSDTRTGDVSGDTFQSWNQVTTAMKDPRYKTDPAYRADVQRRMGPFEGDKRN